MKESKVQYPARITMLDAIALDSEVFNVLKLQIEKIFQILPQWIVSKVELQLDLALHFIMWKLSIDRQHSSFGQQLLNIKYNENDFTPFKGYLLCLGKLSSVYLHHSSTISATFKEYMEKVGSLLRCIELINLIWFFQEGKYPTIGDRILRLRPVYIVNQPREVGYRYMVRELIWHGFIELAGFTLTLVNYQYLRRKFLRLFVHRKITYNEAASLVYTTNTLCTICNDTPILPQHMGCSHIYCYYCIQSNRLVDPKFECPSCGFYRAEISYISGSQI